VAAIRGFEPDLQALCQRSHLACLGRDARKVFLTLPEGYELLERTEARVLAKGEGGSRSNGKAEAEANGKAEAEANGKAEAEGRALFEFLSARRLPAMSGA
jgi:hypothetical protein